MHKPMTMRILVTNDDGVYSPGILALAEAASRYGEVRIVAPDVEQSSMSHAVTATRPLRVRPAKAGEFDAYRVNGTPSDCVMVGAHVWGHVDLVFSGINLGLNVGNSMWHSGTLAAAKQAALLGVRGIAFSSPHEGDLIDYATIRPFVDQVIRELLPMKDCGLINVNFPLRPRGVRWTRQSVRHYDGRVYPVKDPLGREHFWLAPAPLETAEPGTDRHAVEDGFVSITPLRLDLTDHGALSRVLADAAAE
jgi:5'-nucleotidase